MFKLIMLTKATLLILSGSIQHAIAEERLDAPNFYPAESSSIVDTLPTRTDTVSFRAMGMSNPRLDGRQNVQTLGFGSRIDETITAATLNLAIRTSPLLASNMSQLVVRLNGDIIGARAIGPSTQDQLAQLTFEINPSLFTHYNELSFELLAELEHGRCPLNSPNAWIEISAASELILHKQQLRMANELSFFPEPFFDRRDFNTASVNLVSAGPLDTERLKSLSIAASHFGVLSDWRGVDIDYYELTDQQEWPEGHAILFATHDELGQSDIALSSQHQNQSLIIQDNPAFPAYKLLIITGETSLDLKRVAQALALTENAFSGNTASLRAIDVTPRDSHLAPRWISTQRQVEFGELIDHPSELERRGYHPSPVNLNLRLPPDIFTWQRYGIPLDLRFRYTPPLQADESRLRVSVNGQFVQSYALDKSGQQSATERLRVPLVSDAREANRLQLPAFQLSTVNNLSLEYSFQTHLGECTTEPARSTTGVIDPNSTIDLRGYQHYTAMPNLHAFAKAGFPFTKYDDLSQTVAVIGSASNHQHIVTLLNTVASMSASTGYPAVLIDVQTADNGIAIGDKDVLLVGQQALDSFLEHFGDSTLRKQLQHSRFSLNEGQLTDSRAAFTHHGDSAAIVGFESPTSRSRSVVAITASNDSYLNQVRQILGSNELNESIDGFLTYITPARTESFETGQPYYVGELRWWHRWTYHIAQHPVLVAFFALLAVVMITLLIYLVLAQIAQRRQEPKP